MSDAVVTPLGRQPSASVYINQTDAKGRVTQRNLAGGLLDCEVDNNNFYAADTFRCTFSCTGLGDLLKNAGLLADPAPPGIEIEVHMGQTVNAVGGLTRYVVGGVDDVQYDPVRGTLQLSGRDYTSRFIDHRAHGSWVNRSASEIVTQLAQKQGLTPVVTATHDRIGTYLNSSQSQLGSNRTEWDLLTWLAQETLDRTTGNNFVVYVSGRELHFEPRSTGNPYLLPWKPADEKGGPRCAATGLHFSRNLSVLRDTVVVVHSVNMQDKTVVSASYPSEPRGITPGSANVRRQVYEFSYPNITRVQAQQRAQALHADISRHEFRLQAELPGDDVLLPTSTIQVKGTGTAFDQTYYPDSVRRRFSRQGGYQMSVTAKNHITESQVA